MAYEYETWRFGHAYPGDTIYLNVRNQLNGQPTCPYSSCDMKFEFATPNRN